MKEQSSKVAALVAGLPEPDERGFMSVIDKKVVDEVTNGIAAGGAESLSALIGMLTEPGKGEDYKAHYALHCQALAAAREGGQTRRRFAETLAKAIEGDLPAGVKAYLIEEMQVAGGPEVVETLGKQLTDEQLCDPAARALVAIGRQGGRQLAAALPKVSGQCRLNIIQAIAVRGNRRASQVLTKALDDQDQEVRLAALSGVAKAADENSVDAVLKAADKAKGWERIKASQACLALAENLAADDKKQQAKRIYKHIADSRDGEDEAYVRDVAQQAMATL